jgi:diguanylate cyclase (GGDEF)-like protein
VVDVNGLQQVNDSYGQDAGDALLREVGHRLTATARLVDTVARIGGDEFAVLLEHTGGSGATAALARLRRSLAAPPPSLGTGRPVPAALGMAIYRPGDTAVTMLARADAEMYTDKASLG